MEDPHVFNGVAISHVVRHWIVADSRDKKKKEDLRCILAVLRHCDFFLGRLLTIKGSLGYKVTKGRKMNAVNRLTLMLVTVVNLIETGQSNKNVIRMGYITGSKLKVDDAKFSTRHGQRISGAITYARDQINNDSSILPNHTLEFLVAETYSQELHSIKETVDLIDRNISVYIGPQETCVHEGRIAASFNLPMISYVSLLPLQV